MKKRINELMDMFPYFLDKSETSNFFKSQGVTNNQLLKIYQSLLVVKDSLRLDKRCLIWKEQNEPYEYNINFIANYPHLKSVSCYKNDTLIYMEEYPEEDNISSFIYSYDSTLDNALFDETLEDNEEEDEDKPIIPEDAFSIIVETYEEYIIQKGFPENDTIQGNIYDHDISLDEIGALNGIPRKTYKETEDYANTEPAYNNRLTEDDYHYMNRIIEYNLRLHNTPLPVLEIWKLYGTFSDMINREEYLLKMFDETMHAYDEETGLVGDWTPQQWEHKDRLCNLQADLGRFFFVSANTLLPVKNQAVKFNFRYLNSLAEPLTGDYNVTILLHGEEEDTVLVENYPGEQYTVTSELLDEDEPNLFIFQAYYGTELFATEELTVNIRGCNTGDWYVSTSGEDTNTGKINDPFRTLDKALSMVNGEENLIVVTSGTHSTDHIFNVPYTCTVLGCGDPVITSTDGLRFFRVYQNQSLNIQSITLNYGAISSLVENSNWINNNKTDNPLYVILSESAGKTLTTITLSTDYSTYTIGDTINITGTLMENEEHAGLGNKSIKIYINNELVDTVTTLNGGSFSKSITATASGTVLIRAVFEADEDYAGSTGNVSVTVNAPVFDDLEAWTDKPILSYNGGTNPERATLYAQLTYQGSDVRVEGEEIIFEVRKKSDDSLIGTLTGDTNASGLATVYYDSNGTGDLNIKVYPSSRISLIQRYELSDKLFNDDCSTNKLSDYSLVLKSNGGSETLSYSSDYNQMIVNGGEWHGYSPIKVSTSDEWRLEVDITQINQTRGVYISLSLFQSSSIYSSFIGYSGNKWGAYGYGQPNIWIVPQRTVAGHFNINTWYTFVLECENGMFNYYIYLEDGTLLDSASISIPTVYQDKEVDLCITGYPGQQYNPITYRWKNFKVTAL